MKADFCRGAKVASVRHDNKMIIGEPDMKSILKVLFVLWAACASSAQADVIDFEDVPEGTISTDVFSNGFRFLANRNGAIYFTNGVACDPVCASNGTRTMLDHPPGQRQLHSHMRLPYRGRYCTQNYFPHGPCIRYSHFLRGL